MVFKHRSTSQATKPYLLHNSVFEDCLAEGLVEFHRDLGVIASLMLASSVRVNFRISSVGVWAVPAIRLKQMRLFYDNRGRPVGLLTWALLNEETEHRWRTNHQTILHPSEWNEGDKLWLIDFLAPYGHGSSMMRLVRRSMFLNIDRVSWLRRHQDGSIKYIRQFDINRP